MRSGLALRRQYEHLGAYSVCAEFAHDIFERLLIFLEEASKLLVVILQLCVLLDKGDIHAFQFGFKGLCQSCYIVNPWIVVSTYPGSCPY